VRKVKVIPVLNERDRMRFWTKVDRKSSSECWNWSGCGGGGYGCFTMMGVLYKAHRVVWSLFNGSPPLDMCVLHKCDNPPCCNPNHLFLGTRFDNMRDMVKKGRNKTISGEKHWSKTHPEKVARGERHCFNLHPELRPRGEVNGNSKLTDEKVIRIRGLYSRGGITHRELGVRFGVHSCQIKRVLNGKAWAHV